MKCENNFNGTQLSDLDDALKTEANFVFLKNFITSNLIVYNRIESWFRLSFSYADQIVYFP